MQRPLAVLALACLLATTVSSESRQTVPPAQGSPSIPCATLEALKLQDVAITGAASVAAGIRDVAHCRVAGRIDKEINFAVLLPDRWNGSFFGGGEGGFAGTVENQARPNLNLGFATAGTDTGHQADGMDASWALGNPERQINFGHRGIHRMTEVARAIVKAYYGVAPRHAYFYGCSNGGREALMEAQRYPADYDGIVSCAPAMDITNITVAFIAKARLAFPNPNSRESVITDDALALLESKVLEACDAIDGVQDGLLSDPRSCRFDVAKLPACPGDRPASSCVTSAQRTAIAGIYAPVVSGGKPIYPGQPFGVERGWHGWVAGPSPSMAWSFGTQFYKYFVFGRPDWDERTYDFSKWSIETREVASRVNADNPDLSAFKARGGKLILSHGWADPAINPLRTIEYYEQVVARDPRAPAFVRLFLMPGVLHVGGLGPDDVDWTAAIVDWVEHGRAPDSLVARKAAENGQPASSGTLCPYPQRAIYDGKGNMASASSYRCR